MNVRYPKLRAKTTNLALFEVRGFLHVYNFRVTSAHNSGIAHSAKQIIKKRIRKTEEESER